MTRLDLLLLGYVEYVIDEADAAACLEMLKKARISPKNVKRYAKTAEIGFVCTRLEARRLPPAAPFLRLVGEGGIPLLCRCAWHRPGLLCGVLLAILLVSVSGLTVWDIRVIGNERISTEEIEDLMREAGVVRGGWLHAIDVDATAVAVREADSRLAYVAINKRGTVLEVQLREATTPPHTAASPANLVAKSDGVITLPLIFEGECLVREGEAVRAGQLLAGGVIDSEKHGYRVTRAAGQVLARTTSIYEVRVPFTDTEKRYLGKERYDLTLFFFDFRQKVFKSTGNNKNNCDIIDTIKWVFLPNGQRLPVGVGITTYRPYEYATVSHSAVEARALALEELERQLAADSAGRTMLEKHTELRADAEGITLICTVIAEEDIALTREFETVDIPSRKELYEQRDHQSGKQ